MKYLQLLQIAADFQHLEWEIIPDANVCVCEEDLMGNFKFYHLLEKSTGKVVRYFPLLL